MITKNDLNLNLRKRDIQKKYCYYECCIFILFLYYKKISASRCIPHTAG